MARDPYSSALVTGRVPGAGLHLCDDSGRRPAAFERWHGPVDAADRSLLERCTGPVIDVGCGPGRLVGDLASRGVEALGIDVNPHAVTSSLARGAAVLHRSVFDPLPAVGSWGTVLLADGNVGIGGDVATLLARCAELLCAGGLVLVEVDTDAGTDERGSVWWADERGAGRPFPWARVGWGGLLRHAEGLPLRAEARWRHSAREFGLLRRA